MQPAGQRQRRPRFTCMGINAAGRPVPMFDPFFDGGVEVEESPVPVGPLELLLFGKRERTDPEDLPPMRRTTA